MHIPWAGCIILPPVLLLSACSKPTEPIDIPFTARFGATALGCDLEVEGIRLTDLRLFVHDIRLLTRSGEEVPVAIPDDAPWQGGEVALLDFENGAGACRNGSAAVNTTVHGFAASGDYTGLAFRIGVPASRNHADPLQAPPPLNISSMHWHWLTGYKFLRAGVADADDGFWLHLGSTHCEGTVTDPRGCRNANRPRVLLSGFKPGESVVVLDLALLAGTTDLEDGESTDCSSGPAEASCERSFRVLGLDFATGETIGTPALVRVTKSE